METQRLGSDKTKVVAGLTRVQAFGNHICKTLNVNIKRLPTRRSRQEQKIEVDPLIFYNLNNGSNYRRDFNAIRQHTTSD